MEKILPLLGWLTVPQSAARLSSLLEEVVTEADVLRLALEGHLKLSVNLVNGALVRCQSVESLARNRDSDGPLEFDEHVTSISGICELPMVGGERAAVESRFQKLSGGPPVVLGSPMGTLVERDGKLYQLQYDPLKIQLSPSPDFPADSQLVVRSVVIDDFRARWLKMTSDTALDRPLEMRERATLIVIIAALARRAGINIERHSEAARMIEKLTIDLGARVSSRTIEEHLKRVPDALERRASD